LRPFPTYDSISQSCCSDEQSLATEETALLQLWCPGLAIPVMLEKGACARELS